MKRSLISRLAVGSAVAAMAFGMVACEVEDDGMDPGLEDGGELDEGGGEDF